MSSLLNNFIFDYVAKPSSLTEKDPSTCFNTPSPTLCFFPQFNFLVSKEFIIGGHLAYCAIIYVLRNIVMKNRPEIGDVLKGPMLLYNFVQIIVSSLMVIGMLPFFLQIPNIFNINGKFNATIEFWVLAHYLAKFLDMFDTVFIVLRKKDKQFSFLHVYHHTTIGIIWGGLLHYGVGNGTAYFGAWINSLVHALMYSHYFFSSLGFENPLKVYLTQFQMFQFALCIVHALLVSLTTNNYPSSVSYVQMLYHPTLLYLFYDYLMGEKRAKKLAAQKKQQQVEQQKERSASPKSISPPSTPTAVASPSVKKTTTRASSGKKSAAKPVAASPRASSKKKATTSASPKARASSKKSK